MRQDKVIGIILAVMSVILVVVCAVLYIGMDRAAPTIEFQASSFDYLEGMDQSALLRGVSAYDSNDGDVTERIVIEKIIENKENNTVVVFYAVSDKAGNAAKASRVFDAVYVEEEKESGRFPEAGINAEINLSGEIYQVETDAETDIPQQDSDSEPVPDQPPEPSPEPEQPSPTPAPTPEPTAEPTPRPVPTADPAIPVLTLKVSEVKVKAGQGPAWVNLIGILSDDKDSYETLFHNLSVSKYDRDKAGSYAVSVQTEDSDGNKSQSVPLTIIVE